MIILRVFAAIFVVILLSRSYVAQQSNLDQLKAQFLPAEFSATNFTVEDAKKILKEKCRKVSGNNETVFLEAQKGVPEFLKCISGVANLTVLQKEIEIAKPIGELDTVFSKYCEKRPHVETCVSTLNNKIQPCLSTEEKAHNEIMLRIATRLLGFICHKGGDQIALFVAEQGPECLEANKENINSCMNSSFASYVPTNGIPDVNNLPQLVIGKKECIDLQEFEDCVLFHLEKCNDITPSNIIESVFKFVKNETKCQTTTTKIGEKSARSGGEMYLMNFTIFVAFLITFASYTNKFYFLN